MKNGIITTDYDPTTTSTYKVVNPIFESFMQQVQEQEDEIAKKIIEDKTVVKTYTEEYTDSKGNKKTRTITEIIKPNVITELNYINHGYAFAYINMKDQKMMFGSKFKSTKARKKMIKEFYSSINAVKTKQTGEMDYVVYNEFLSIEEVAELYFSNDEADKSMFLTAYELYCQFFGNSISGTGTITDGGGKGIDPYDDGSEDESSEDDESEKNEGENVEGGMDIPLYLQYSGSWARQSYGNGTISQNGCAPTSLAMVVSYMTGNAVLPSDIVDYVGNKYYVNGTGSSWGIFAAVAIHYQFSCSDLGKNEQAVIDALKAGRPVIASMGPGTFTKSGHIIVLRGITSSGQILVNDPNDNSTKNHKGKAFDMSLIMSEAKNFWSFY